MYSIVQHKTYVEDLEAMFHLYVWEKVNANGITPDLGCDKVDKILNATLVIPHFEVNPVWQDSSLFAYIFDVDHFIDVLCDEVSIVKELPNDYCWSTREYYGTCIRATRIKIAHVQATTDCYIENVLPVLQSYGIAAISPFSHRLTFKILQGLFNSIVYGLNSSVRRAICERLNK
ncbi:hypothetical protein Fmac_011306 [Flemingia macrophylla]|uniref:O-fucosyltransferase family protein n=1 Tax=Flemingia macrophylla TaxID=520843 RepID=A0ABD1MP63_9FABA